MHIIPCTLCLFIALDLDHLDLLMLLILQVSQSNLVLIRSVYIFLRYFFFNILQVKKYPSLQSASMCKDFQNLKINGNGCNQDESQAKTLDLTNKQHNGKIFTNNELDLIEDQK